MKTQKIPSAAFTLTELVIVITILGILFSIGGNLYRDQQKQFTFNDTSTRIISLIKKARNHVITSRSAFINEKTIVPKNGYGIFIKRGKTPNDSSLTLFANTGSEPERFDENDFVEEVFFIPELVVFEGLFKNDKTTKILNDNAVIIFKPLLAETFISNNDDPDVSGNLVDTLFMRFSNRNTSSEAKTFITINRTAGFPEVEL